MGKWGEKWGECSGYISPRLRVMIDLQGKSGQYSFSLMFYFNIIINHFCISSSSHTCPEKLIPLFSVLRTSTWIYQPVTVWYLLVLSYYGLLLTGNGWYYNMVALADWHIIANTPPIGETFRLSLSSVTSA